MAMQRRFSGVMPLLARPAGPRPGEAEWHIAGLDVRDFANWRWRPILGDEV